MAIDLRMTATELLHGLGPKWLKKSPCASP